MGWQRGEMNDVGDGLGREIDLGDAPKNDAEDGFATKWNEDELTG